VTHPLIELGAFPALPFLMGHRNKLHKEDDDTKLCKTKIAGIVADCACKSRLFLQNIFSE